MQARRQAELFAQDLKAHHPNVDVDLVFVDTMGDRRTDVPLHAIGGQGVFVKEVQLAVLQGLADLAVHSAKDLPSTPADGLVIGAFGPRRDARDALIGRSLADLPHGAVVASGSVRRRAQLQRIRPDLAFVELRGNIPTRLEKIPDGGSIVMAVAALEILEWTERIAQYLDVDTMVPAVGQGSVAVECRVDDERVIDLLEAVDHETTRRRVEHERAFLAEMGSGCSLPVGAYDDGEQMFIHVSSDDATVHHRAVVLTGYDTDHDVVLRSARDAAAVAMTAVGR